MRVLITADDRATPTIKSIASGIVAADVAMKAFNTTVGGLKSVVSVAADFEHAISSVGAVSGATKDQLKELSDTALRIGKDTQFGAREAAGAMEILAANGISVTDIMGGAADATATLAAAGGTNLAQAADTVSTAMAVWGANTSDLTDYVNRLAGAANVSRFGVDDMSQAIAQGGGVAASVGVDFKDFAASIAATATSFSSGSDAGTSFKTFLQRLAAPTDDAAKLMKQLGINAFDATGQMLPMGAIVDQLHNSLGMMTEAQRAQAASMIFGSDAMRTALGLAGMTREEFEKLQKTMGDTSAMDVAKQRTDNLAGAWEQFKGSVETIEIEIGQKLLPILADLATWGAEKLPAAFAWAEEHWGPAFAAASDAAGFLVAKLNELGGWLGENEGLATALADGIAIATAGMIAFAAASLAASLVNPFTATVLAIEALTVAVVYLVQNWEDVERAAARAGISFEAIGDTAVAVADTLTDAADATANFGEEVGRNIESAYQYVHELPDRFADLLSSLPDRMRDAGKEAVEGFRDGLEDGAQAMWDRAASIFDPRNWDIPGGSPLMHAMDEFGNEAGMTFTEAFAAGIDSGSSSVLASMAALGQAINQTATGYAAQAASNARSVFLAGVNFDTSQANYLPAGVPPDYYLQGYYNDTFGTDIAGNPIQGPNIGMSAADWDLANKRARDYINSLNTKTFNLGGGGGSSGGGGGSSSSKKKTPAEELADAIAEVTRNASLTLAFGDLGAKAMETFLDAFESPSKAGSLPGAIEKIIDQAKAAGVPQTKELGDGLLQAMLDAFAGTGSIELVQSKLNDIVLATTNGLKGMVKKASDVLSTSALSDSARRTAEGALKAFQQAIDDGDDVSAQKLKDFLDKLVQDSDDGWETLREVTADKLQRWLDTTVGKLADAKPETAEQLRSMLDGLESILNSAPLPTSMEQFADAAIDRFLKAIRDGKGIAAQDLKDFIDELIRMAQEGAQAVKDATAGKTKPPGAAGGPSDEPKGPASSPGGMGNPSVNYQDPRGVTLTADDILRARAQNDGFVGLPAPITIQFNGPTTIGSRGDVEQLAGDASFALAARGLAVGV